MAKPFNKLKQRMSPEALARAEKRTQRMLDETLLSELPAARLLKQESITKSESTQVEIAARVMSEDRDALKRLAE